MQHQILGTTMPVLEFSLASGEAIVSESGRLSWMSADITMQTDTAATGGGGGLLGGLRRMAGGGTLFASTYTAGAQGGRIAFAATLPGQILPISVTPNNGYLAHRHGFLAATQGIELSYGFQQSLGAGLFGGEGFILQRLSGNADAWIQLQGEVVKYDLQSGQTMLVHPGHIGMFTDTMPFELTSIRGIRNKFFGDALILVALSGPGTLWLQSLTLPHLAADIAPYLPQQQQ